MERPLPALKTADAGHTGTETFLPFKTEMPLPPLISVSALTARTMSAALIFKC